MNINAIYKKAVNNGYEVKTVTTNSGKCAIIIEGWNTPDFYNCIHSIYRKCNVHIDFHYATKSAWNRLSDYKVSRGQLHYAVLKSVSDTGTEKYYRDEEAEKGTALFIGLVGAALGMSQVAQYGQYKSYTNSLKDAQTLYLINKVE